MVVTEGIAEDMSKRKSEIEGDPKGLGVKSVRQAT